MSRIIIASNKTLPRDGKQELDTGTFYVYEPLIELGHEVYYYDTVSPVYPDFDQVVETLNPDLIFCCFTGNPYITPFEPWRSIQKLTEEGKVKTFNWFCDDTWRFDYFSSKACHMFNYCSTPEPDFIKKFEDIGYKNILLGAWCANSKYYPTIEYENKGIELSFVGGMNTDRSKFFTQSKVPVTLGSGLNIEELFGFYCNSKIGINLSLNINDPERKTQMKQRVFELAAANCVVLTEYHKGIEEFFDVGKEIITFSDVDDFEKKVNYFCSHPEESKKIASNGHKRFLKDHDSKIRLKKIVETVLNES